MEAAFCRLHSIGAGAIGARPNVVESIVVDGEIDGSMYDAISKSPPQGRGQKMVQKLPPLSKDQNGPKTKAPAQMR